MAKSYFMLCQHDMQEQCMPYYLMYYLRYFCLLAHSGVQHILCCFLLCFFFRLVYPMFQFLWIVNYFIATSVFSNVYFTQSHMQGYVSQ